LNIFVSACLESFNIKFTSASEIPKYKLRTVTGERQREREPESRPSRWSVVPVSTLIIVERRRRKRRRRRRREILGGRGKGRGRGGKFIQGLTP